MKASCPRGTLLYLQPETSTARAVPAFCHRWDCPSCGPRKAAAHMARVFAAQPERHITLTMHNRRYKTPLHALKKAKDSLRKLRHLLAHPEQRPASLDDGKTYRLEYAAIWELTKAGWPHAHCATWGDFIPQALLSKLWQKLTQSPNVHISDMSHSPEHTHNFQKYLTRKFHSIAMLNPRAKRITYSAEYDRYPSAADRPAQGTAPTIVHVRIPHHILCHYLVAVCKLVELHDESGEGATFQGDLSAVPYDPAHLYEAVYSWAEHNGIFIPSPTYQFIDLANPLNGP